MAPRPSLALAARLAGLLALCARRGDAASMAVTSDSSFASTEQTQPESMRQLEQHYVRSVLPVEIKYRFDIMKLLAPKRASSFKATKPLILLVGPYSSGKTTLIHYLVGQDVPGTRISPEPVDDGFTIVQHGPVDEEVKGRAVWNDRGHRFTGMKRNSEAFMEPASHAATQAFSSATSLSTRRVSSATRGGSSAATTCRGQLRTGPRRLRSCLWSSISRSR